jgi:hypothetical protein
MQKGGQRLDADSGASRVIKVFLAQRPTKMLLTFGTRLYDEQKKTRDIIGLASPGSQSRSPGPGREAASPFQGFSKLGPQDRSQPTDRFQDRFRPISTGGPRGPRDITIKFN